MLGAMWAEGQSKCPTDSDQITWMLAWLSEPGPSSGKVSPSVEQMVNTIHCHLVIITTTHE